MPTFNKDDDDNDDDDDDAGWLVTRVNMN